MDATVDTPTENWPDAIYRVLKDADVRQACYVPDAGHTRLINKLIADPDVETTVLTTEEEGIPIAAGAWLGGHYGETGMQLSHSGLGVDLHRIADAAGFAAVREIASMDEIDSYRSEIRKVGGGPRYATIRIAPGNPDRALPNRDGVFLKNRVRGHLGLPVT